VDAATVIRDPRYCDFDIASGVFKARYVRVETGPLPAGGPVSEGADFDPVEALGVTEH
jgi:hypothetical protein